MSAKKLLLSLSAAGLLAVSFYQPQPDRAAPGLADRDFRGNDGKGN